MVLQSGRKGEEKWGFMEVQATTLFVLLMCSLAVYGPLADGAATAGSESKTAYACEDGQLVLACQAGEVIRILRANYGRFTISLCNRHGQTDGWNLQCMSPKAKDIISERCDGRRECDMRVNNHIFVDPCPSTSKYAEVKYTCHLAPIETPHVQTSLTALPPLLPVMPLNGSPRPPQITSATALSSSQIEITWTQAEPPSPILTTLVYIKDLAMDTEPSSVYTNSEGSLIVEELRPNTSYSISLKSVNIHGPSITSNTVSVTTLPFEESHITTTTVRTEAARLDYFSAPTKLPSVTSKGSLSASILDDESVTVATFYKSTTIKPDLSPSDVELSSNNYSPNDPEDADNTEDDIDRYNNGVVDTFCEEKIFRGIFWPQTRFGRIVEKNCPGGLIGTVTWHCLDYGWEKPGPDLSNCTSVWMEKMDSQITKVMRGKEPADQAALALNEAMMGQEFTPGDLKKASIKLLPKLAKGLHRDDPGVSRFDKLNDMKKFKKAFMSTSSDLLSKKNFQSWRSLSRQDRRRAATSLVLAIEDVGFHTAKLMDIGTSEVTSDVTVVENIIMEVTVMDTQQTHNDITFPSKKYLWGTSWEAEADSSFITIRSTSLKVAGMRGPIHIVFTLYKNMEDLIQPQVNSFTSLPTPSSSNDDEGDYNAGTVRDNTSSEGPGTSAVRVVNSKIISASISSTKPNRKLTEPVWFILQHLEPTNKGKPLCSFWDVNTSYLNGQWSQNGCRLLDTNSTHTTCECDHLTNFAVLMDITGVKMSQDNELALRVITFVGCVISVICLMLSWITFLVFKNLQCDRNTIHRNLVFCLLLAEIVFLGGIAQTEPKIVCSIIAGILHYLFMGAFAWMCLEGVQLYIMLVEVFEQEKSRVHWYYLFGYGIPAVVVAVSAGVYHEGYGTARHCWLTTENYFIWSFVGPALAVMLINIVLLSIAIYTMCRHSIMSVTTREKSKSIKFSVTDNLGSMKTFAPPKLRFPDLPVWVKGAIILVVLLGLTWLLGVLYLNEESVVIAYFFTVLNSLQGLFIFVFHCLKNDKVQKEYRKVVRRTSWLPDCIRVNYGGYTGMISNSQVPTSDSRNYLSKLFGQKKDGNSTESTSNSAKPFLSIEEQKRCDIENSSTMKPSNIPSSLNGYVYNPSYSINGGNGNVMTPFLSSNHDVSVSSQVAVDSGYEIGGEMPMDLSEHADYSIVDSEYASEYCEDGNQVSREQFRYSTVSQDSYEEKSVIPCNNIHMNNLSTFSATSGSRKPSFCQYNAETLNKPCVVDLDKCPKKTHEEASLSQHLNFHQYVIPASRKSSRGSDVTVIRERSQNVDNVSASLNRINNPFPTPSSIPEAQTSTQHSSSPDLQFRQSYTEPALGSTATNSRG